MSVWIEPRMIARSGWILHLQKQKHDNDRHRCSYKDSNKTFLQELTRLPALQRLLMRLGDWHCNGVIQRWIFQVSESTSGAVCHGGSRLKRAGKKMKWILGGSARGANRNDGMRVVCLPRLYSNIDGFLPLVFFNLFPSSSSYLFHLKWGCFYLSRQRLWGLLPLLHLLLLFLLALVLVLVLAQLKTRQHQLALQKSSSLSRWPLQTTHVHFKILSMKPAAVGAYLTIGLLSLLYLELTIFSSWIQQRACRQIISWYGYGYSIYLFWSCKPNNYVHCRTIQVIDRPTDHS